MSVHDLAYDAERVAGEAKEAAVEASAACDLAGWPATTVTDTIERLAAGLSALAGSVETLARGLRELDDKVDENDRRQDPHYDPGDE